MLGTKYLTEDETHILCTVDGVRKIVSLLNVTTLVLRNNKHERYAVYYDAVNVDIKVIDKKDTNNVWYASASHSVPARKVYAMFSMLPYYVTDILFKHHTAICTFHNAYMFSKEHRQ
jgi:cAMP phosphodiesterase